MRTIALTTLKQQTQFSFINDPPPRGLALTMYGNIKGEGKSKGNSRTERNCLITKTAGLSPHPHFFCTNCVSLASPALQNISVNHGPHRVQWSHKFMTEPKIPVIEITAPDITHVFVLMMV